MNDENEQDQVGKDQVEEEVAALRQQLARTASRAIVGGGADGLAPSESLTSSWFGQVLVGLPGEEWPLGGGDDGMEPLMPLCQINVSELPHRPDTLDDIAFITLFIDAEETPIGENNGDRWLLRTYPSLDGLVALPLPYEADRGAWQIQAVPMRWEAVVDDFPCWQDVMDVAMSSEVRDRFSERLPNDRSTKVGGWPSMVQGPIYATPWSESPKMTDDATQFVFQIASEAEAGWMWGDAGVGYFGRGMGENKDEWIIDWQCY